MDFLYVLTLVVLAFAVIYALQTFGLRRRVEDEQKVMKGYFLLGLSGLMAKIAQADGTVSISESEITQRFFDRMDLSDAERALCLGNFITARKDGLSPRDHARRFMAYANSAACAFLYDLLWRISRADGVLADSEDALLKDLARDLGLPESLYDDFKANKKPTHDYAALKAAGVPPSLLALAR